MKLELTEQEVRIILSLIGEKPLSQGYDLFNKIKDQLIAQEEKKDE